MTFMLRYLTERDSLGIVEFGSDVKVAAPLTRCDQDGRARLAHALQKIEATGVKQGAPLASLAQSQLLRLLYTP